MSRRLKVGVLGATGMVGQRFVTLLEQHPWVVDASDIARVSDGVDFVFCAVDMPRDATAKLEEDNARRETPVVSNNSAHRWTPDVPMLVPELNAEHAAVIAAQRRRLGTARGFVTVKPNCSIPSYVPALHPLWRFGPTRVAVCTYQAVSGAGKTLQGWPEVADNVIPFISVNYVDRSGEAVVAVLGRLACQGARARGARTRRAPGRPVRRQPTARSRTGRRPARSRRPTR